jgi:hypothetical protein
LRGQLSLAEDVERAGQHGAPASLRVEDVVPGEGRRKLLLDDLQDHCLLVIFIAVVCLTDNPLFGNDPRNDGAALIHLILAAAEHTG